MAERFGLPVGIENDANAATYAEFHFGAAREAQTTVMLTLGTGCGGGAVLDGKLYRGWAEFGHMVIVEDGVPCQGTCTGHGHVESYCSGVAPVSMMRQIAMAPPRWTARRVPVLDPALTGPAAELGLHVVRVEPAGCK